MCLLEFKRNYLWKSVNKTSKVCKETEMLKRINKLRNGGKYEEMEGDTRVQKDTCTSASESNVTSDTASCSGVSDVATIEGKTM